MAVPDRIELVSGLVAYQQSLSLSIAGRLRSIRETLTHLQPRLVRCRPDLDSLRMRIDDLLSSVATHLRRDVEVKSERTASLRMRLESLSPRDTLRRGYAVVQRREDGAVVNDVAQVSAGDTVNVTLARGGFDAEVMSTKRKQGVPSRIG